MANTHEYGCWQVVATLKEPNVHKVQIKNRPNDRVCVLKCLPDDSGNYLRFRKEIEILQGLNHPNVLQLIDYDLNPLNPYFVTPYYNLGSLDKVRVRKNWKRPIKKGIIRGYSYLHQQGIAKSDNNAKNIFLHQPVSGSAPKAIVGDFAGHKITTDPNRITDTWMKVFRMIDDLKQQV